VKKTIFSLAMVLTLGSASLLNARVESGETSLKTAHQVLIDAVKSGNLAILQAVIHPRALGFYRESQFAVQLRSDYSAGDALPAVLDDLSRFVTIPSDAIYRAVGDVGVVCLSATLTAKKGEKDPTRYVRGTYVYINVAGNWKLLSWHSSDVPLKKK